MYFSDTQRVKNLSPYEKLCPYCILIIKNVILHQNLMIMENKKLFEQVSFPKLTLKNRFVRSGVWMKMADEQGHITPELKDVYKSLVDGGVGLIITEYTFIDKYDQPNPGMIGMYDDLFIDEWKEIIDYAHANGTKIACQIAAGGSQSGLEEAKQRRIMGPSAVLNRVSGITPAEMNEDDFNRLIENHKNAALRVKRAGFDAVQIHAAHGYLLSQFLTPYYNRRTDKYGGSLHNRARIIYDVVSAVRSAVGDDYTVMIKVNMDDFMAEGEGLTFPESLEMFKHLDTLGLDFIEPSGANISAGNGIIQSFPRIARSVEKQSYFKEQVTEIAKNIKTPVILVGGNRNTTVMTDLLNNAGIPLFSFGRTLFSEPDLINKWVDNPDYVPKCVACNKCWDTTPNSCILNRKRK